MTKNQVYFSIFMLSVFLETAGCLYIQKAHEIIDPGEGKSRFSSTADLSKTGIVPKIIELDESIEFIEKWYVCGAFARTGCPELREKWGGISAIDVDYHNLFEERYECKTGAASWLSKNIRTVEMPSKDPITGKIRPKETRIIDFLEAFPDKSVDSSAYALAFVNSDDKQTRTLLVGSDDGITIWLNGLEIQRSEKERPIVPDEDFAIAHFKPGLNILLVEVTNARGYWGFMLRMPPPGKTSLLPLGVILDEATRKRGPEPKNKTN